jgi:acyl carrier protein
MVESVIDRVERILKGVFDLTTENVDINSGPEQIEGWDSMAHLDLVMALGEEFGIDLEFDEVMSIGVIRDIYSVLDRRGIK